LKNPQKKVRQSQQGEIISMDYYVLGFTSAEKGESGESCGSKYDLSRACKKCGTGAILVGPLIAKKLANVKGHVIQTLDRDIIISKKCMDLLTDIGIPSELMSQVVAKSGIKFDFFHLSPFVQLPKRKRGSKGLVTDMQCSVCRRDGFFNDAKIGDVWAGVPTTIVPLQFRYQNVKKLLKGADLFTTWECKGLSRLENDGLRVTRYARPMLVVSERVMKVMKALQPKGIEFFKIVIE